jgi:hypothetical protein
VTEISKKSKIPYKYLFGAFFLIMSFGSIVSHGYIAGLLFFLAAIFTIPQAVNQLKKKVNVSMPGIAQFFVVFLLVAIAFAASPATPAATNNTSSNTEKIAASPSSVNSSEAIAVPANETPVTTSNSTPNPANTSAAKKAPKTVSTPTSTPTQTLDNKEKLDILTSPDGATITVDGVSEGKSPIEGLSVDAGTHTVEAYLSGYSLQKEKVEIANSETKKLFYTLVPETNESTISTSVATSQESSNSTTSETTMQLSESKQKELIELVEQYYDAKNVEVSFISNKNGLVLVTYRINSVPSKEKLSADISGILMIANSIASESGIPDANANVVVETTDGTPIGTGTYYPLRETGKMDIDVS